MPTVKKKRKGRKRAAKPKKKAENADKKPTRERVDIEEMAEWLPSWVLPRHLTESELRQPLKGRSL